MPTSAPGSSAFALPARACRRARRTGRGFTLLELMVVVAIIALAAGAISLAIRDPDAARLDVEAERLALLLEEARAQSRASGIAAAWKPVDEAGAAGFRFVGLPEALAPAGRWLADGVSAQVVGAAAVSLGPEALLAPQRIVLRLGDRRVEIATDGIGPFGIVPAPAEAPR